MFSFSLAHARWIQNLSHFTRPALGPKEALCSLSKSHCLVSRYFVHKILCGHRSSICVHITKASEPSLATSKILFIWLFCCGRSLIFRWRIPMSTSISKTYYLCSEDAMSDIICEVTYWVLQEGPHYARCPHHWMPQGLCCAHTVKKLLHRFCK